MPPHTARTEAELTSRDEILSMSGLDFLTAIAEGRLPGPPIAETLGFTLREVTAGRVVFAGTPGFATMNPIGSVHGGWYGTLLDSCMACAVQSMLPQGSVYTTLEYKVNITRPIPPGTTVEAVGETQHVGRSTGVARGEIRGAGDGRLYATGSTTCIVITP